MDGPLGELVVARDVGGLVAEVVLGAQVAFALDGVQVPRLHHAFVVSRLPILVVVSQIVQYKLEFILVIGPAFASDRLIWCTDGAGLAGLDARSHEHLVYTRVSGRIVPVIDFAALTHG